MKDALDTALDRARVAALQTRKKDGSWCFSADVGPISTAQAVIALHRTSLLSSKLVPKLARFLVRQQREDGSFLRYVQAECGDPATTAVCAAALRLLGEEAAATKAFGWVALNGGLEGVVEGLNRGELAVGFLVAAGTLPPSILGRHGVEIFAIPGFEVAFLRRFHAGVLMAFAQLAFLARGQDPNGFLMAPALKAAMNLCADFQNEDGSYNSFTFPTALAACAWSALGDAMGTDRAQRAGRWILGRVEEGPEEACVQGFQLSVWSTTFHLRALIYAGEPLENLLPSVKWLCDAQCTSPQQRRNNPTGRVHVGGWAFDPQNTTMPDNDDTGAVLSVLSLVARRLPPDHPLQLRIRDAQNQAKTWLLEMQNRDGGWASYTRGLPGKPPGPALSQRFEVGSGWYERLNVWIKPPLHLGDPSTEDVTARVIDGLGAQLEGPARDRALAFLEIQQGADGSFWGRWLMNYLAGTAFVLMAMEGVSLPWVRRAVDWVVARQNEDGSWGETPASYRDPAMAGRGPGMAPLTGLVLNSLLLSGLRESEPVRRATRYLLEHQTSDGRWPEDGWLTPLLLPDTFYSHPQAGLYYPLEALGRLRHPEI